MFAYLSACPPQMCQQERHCPLRGPLAQLVRISRQQGFELAWITTKCERYTAQGKGIPRRVWHGMDEGFRRIEQIEHRVQILLGIFWAHGVLPLEFKPAHNIGDLIVQHLDTLEQEADRKGGAQQVLADHFARIYKVRLGPGAAA